MPPGALTPIARTRSAYGSTISMRVETASSAVEKSVGIDPRSRMEKSSPRTAHLTLVPPISIPKNSSIPFSFIYMPPVYDVRPPCERAMRPNGGNLESRQYGYSALTVRTRNIMY